VLWDKFLTVLSTRDVAEKHQIVDDVPPCVPDAFCDLREPWWEQACKEFSIPLTSTNRAEKLKWLRSPEVVEKKLHKPLKRS
jgi:hypothetical protein